MKKSKRKTVVRANSKAEGEATPIDRSRLTEWYEVLKKCRIGLTSVALVLLVFILSDQAQDVLRALGQPGTVGLLLSFELLLWIWTLMNWSGAFWPRGRPREMAIKSHPPSKGGFFQHSA
jgi:hypothetical protein